MRRRIWCFTPTTGVDLQQSASYAKLSQGTLAYLHPYFLEQTFGEFLVAERISWAAKRSTSRTEDMAYCLMGLFDVNMPLLYGEGERAFLRLQQELIKSQNDRSLFYWAAKTASSTTFRVLLAISRAKFESFNEYDLGSI